MMGDQFRRGGFFDSQAVSCGGLTDARFGLRDDQWERIKHLLPGREGSVGVTAADNRLFVEAVLYRYRTGCRGAICRSGSVTG